MSAAEFRITTDLAPLRQFQIEANFEETKAWLTENLEPLRTMAVTPESTAQAKQYRAAVRKIRDRIDESRKMAKAAALEAYSSFETKCKELTALCEEAANALDVQIKAMEEAAKQEKKNRLAEYFAKVVGDMAEWLTFDDLFNPKWLNATYAESTAWMDINAAIDRCRADLNAIRALHSEFETTLLEEYTRTRNIGAVLVKNETLGRMKAAEEERKRKEAESAAKYAAVEEPVSQEVPSVADVIRSVEQEAFAFAADVEEPTYTLYFDPHCTDEQFMELLKYMDGAGIRRTLRVDGTAAQLNGLRSYMKNNGIRFERVPE